MINSYEKEKLSSLLKDFYVAIGMRISVFDDQFRLITEYPQHPPELCAMIRSTEKGFAACKKCDEEAFLRARKMHTAHSYVCHAGLTEAITPILLDREVMGYAIFAHLLLPKIIESTSTKFANAAKTIAIRRKKFAPPFPN